ncbi:MAG: hypothetical protein P4M11_08455 [Candidatus Pacebacteria bacterium]|nr:hypothetical protein [Candidatus Paceibacterota bacterium]
MATYSFRGHEEKPVASAVDSTNSSSKVVSPDTNPFVDAPVVTISQPAADASSSVERDPLSLMLHHNPQMPRKHQPIMASPNFMLVKKTVDKSKPGRSILSRFSSKETSAVPDHGIRPEDDHPVTIATAAAEQPITLVSTCENVVSLSSHEMQKPEPKEPAGLVSQRAPSGCCVNFEGKEGAGSCECRVF